MVATGARRAAVTYAAVPPTPRPGAGLPVVGGARPPRWQPPSELTAEERRDRRTLVRHYLHELVDRYRDLEEGEPASYIPALARADRDAFGIAVMALDGSENHVGDAHDLFSIQSISKVLLYALVLEQLGRDEVHPVGQPGPLVVGADRRFDQEAAPGRFAGGRRRAAVRDGHRWRGSRV